MAREINATLQCPRKQRTETPGLWKRVVSLAQRPVENELVHWGTFQSSGPGQADLIGAQMHVAYAEIYQFTTGEMRKAEAEIQEARAALKQAAPHTEDAAKPKFAEIDQTLAEVARELANQKPVARNQYEKIKTDMVRLMGTFDSDGGKQS